MTINKLTEAAIWPRFDEQNYLEFCPSVCTLPNGERWVAFRRNKRPPVWGAGEIWMVRVDEELHPFGAPFQLIPEGEDPRLLLIGERLFLFYVYVDRNTQGEIIGTTIALAEMTWQNGFELIHHVKLPQNPLGTAKKPENSLLGYEKNWVPFFIDLNTIGILYSHSPWIVLELIIAGPPSNWRLGTTHQGQGIEWGYGEIRGGSVPIPYGRDEYITFFHSSAKTGGKKIYYGGACIFSRSAPYSARYFTPEPLTTSPFKSGSDKHGWYLGQPIIFPLGVAFNGARDSYDVLCSLDDAFICKYSIPSRYLRERLLAVEGEQAILRKLSYRKTFPDDQDLFALTRKSRIAAQDELIRFFNAIEASGDLFIDIGADDGDLLVTLHSQFRRTLAVSLTASAQAIRERNARINKLDRLSLMNPAEFGSAIAAMAETVHERSTRINELDRLSSMNGAELGASIAAMAAATEAGASETWIRFDCSEASIDLHHYIPLALQMRSSMLFAGVPQQTMQNLYSQYQMSGYAVSTIAAGDQLMYLFIAGHQVPKYQWFI
ncbi:hypothetical protein [Herbaspirillum robiniae]|uniref:hypothetical protein n=1 Tax=Herbaspirillum robiniae TaxID=2014887 RepID=UPI003D784F7C